MSSSLWHMPLHDFQRAVETRSTPGCGAAAALNGCLGLSLVLKGVQLANDKSDAQQRLIEAGESLQRALAAAVDDDAAAFSRYLEARKRPADSAHARQQREAALAAAGEEAIRIPLAAAERCLAALALALDIRPLTGAMLQSDIRAGAALLGGALEALLVGVEANLAGQPDSVGRLSHEARCRELREAGQAYRRQLDPPD
ncbi:cyclodeaminase/cyclohydrolase family protein [Salinicola avicenniae]|uniref:cyclodeaminase/cyclohydrolase family protein n=1 Tax=Salinicola avicenniae TaxID=2916836 RepID=UPI002073AD3F|nr:MULTISPECIES: cyclodeaminase/cyclohydrolase family protein [unclassified Salinicola]